MMIFTVVLAPGMHGLVRLGPHPGHPELSLEPLNGGTATGTYATAKTCLLVAVKPLGILGVTFMRGIRSL